MRPFHSAVMRGRGQALLSLRSLVMVATTLILVLTIGGAIYINVLIQEIDKEDIAGQAVADVRATVFDLVMLADDFRRRPGPRVQLQWNTVIDRLSTHLRKAIEVVPSQRAEFERIVSMLSEINTDLAFTDWGKSGSTRTYEERNLLVHLHRIGAVASAVGQVVSRESRLATKDLRQISFFIVVVIVLSGFSILFLVMLPMDKALRKLHLEIKSLGRNVDLERRISPSNFTEFDSIVRAVNGMLEQLEKLTVSRDEMGHEIQERKLAEAEARRALAELRETQNKMIQVEKLSALGTMVGGVAHELNNPMMGIDNYIAYAIDRVDEGRPREMLGRAREEIKRISRIVRSLLIFSRSEIITGGACDVEPVIVKAVELARVDTAMNIDITLQVPEGLPSVAIDADALQQVLLNLLTNARDAIEASGNAEEGRILLRVESLDDGVVIKIEDNGPGIPDDVINKIFDPFFTTKGVGKGTGLGLSVSNQLVVDADGELKVINRTDGGARFTVRLPPAKTDTPPQPHERKGEES